MSNINIIKIIETARLLLVNKLFLLLIPWQPMKSSTTVLELKDIGTTEVSHIISIQFFR